MKEFIKLNISKVSLAVFFVIWQLIHNFQLINVLPLTELSNDLSTGFGLVNWGNYYLNKLSLFLLWIALALLIFAALFLFEAVSAHFYNRNLERKFANQSKESYEHLLRQGGGKLWEHFYPKLFKILGVMLVLVAMFSLSYALEDIRLKSLNLVVSDLLENDVNFFGHCSACFFLCCNDFPLVSSFFRCALAV